MKYSDEYVQRLEDAAERLMFAAEQAVSIIDKTRLALVNPDVAQKSLDDALDQYHGVGRDFDND
ncbi:MAG: hypothetical protein ACPH3C_03050 [Glaciecola sp.]